MYAYVLDVVGLIPVVGEIADGINGVVSLARGNYADTALSLVAMVPVFGDAIGKGGKVAKFVATKGDDLLFQARRIVCNLVAEGCFAAGTEVLLSSVAADSHNSSDSSAGIATLQRTATRMAIESVPLGSRVATANPRTWEYDGRFAEPDQSTWRQVTLELKRENGGMMDIQLLRPIDELERLGAVVGSYVPMRFADLAFGGLALVKSIDPCPSIAEGEGNVVISRFVTRMAMELTELTLTDGVKLTGTSNHPVWSYDRGDWIELGELSINERLLGRNGPVEILAKRPVQSAESVFNLEINGEHVYQVTELGVLVHNACPSKILGRNLADGSEEARIAMTAKGFIAAHIIPAKGFSRRNQKVRDAIDAARETLARVGIDLNAAVNGFWTKNSRHMGTHTNSFLLAAGEALQGLSDKSAVEAALAHLKTRINNNEFLY